MEKNTYCNSCLVLPIHQPIRFYFFNKLHLVYFLDLLVILYFVAAKLIARILTLTSGIRIIFA